jgi:hypothetical protein
VFQFVKYLHAKEYVASVFRVTGATATVCAGFIFILLGLFFDPEAGSDMFLQHVG